MFYKVKSTSGIRVIDFDGRSNFKAVFSGEVKSVYNRRGYDFEEVVRSLCKDFNYEFYSLLDALVDANAKGLLGIYIDNGDTLKSYKCMDMTNRDLVISHLDSRDLNTQP